MKKALSMALIFAGFTLVGSLAPVDAAEYKLSIATGNARPHPTLAMADYMKGTSKNTHHSTVIG